MEELRINCNSNTSSQQSRVEMQLATPFLENAVSHAVSLARSILKQLKCKKDDETVFYLPLGTLDPGGWSIGGRSGSLMP
jgi:hypothetical protein